MKAIVWLSAISFVAGIPVGVAIGWTDGGEAACKSVNPHSYFEKRKCWIDDHQKQVTVWEEERE